MFFVFYFWFHSWLTVSNSSTRAINFTKIVCIQKLSSFSPIYLTKTASSKCFHPKDYNTLYKVDIFILYCSTFLSRRFMLLSVFLYFVDFSLFFFICIISLYLINVFSFRFSFSGNLLLTHIEHFFMRFFL